MSNQLGRKIVVVGVSASGKSTFTRELSKKLGIELILMDSIMWKPGWEYVGDDEVNKKLSEISSGPDWLIEGYITRNSRTIVFNRADSIIYLDYSPLLSGWRYVKRCWRHRKVAREELLGSPDKFSLKFLWLVLTKGEAISLNKFLDEVSDSSKIIRFTSPRQALNFINKL